MYKVIHIFRVTLFLLSVVGYHILEFIWRILRLPVRFTYCQAKGHEWLWLGNGFFGMFAPKKNFKCIKCGFKTCHPENYKTVKHQEVDE